MNLLDILAADIVCVKSELSKKEALYNKFKTLVVRDVDIKDIPEKILAHVCSINEPSTKYKLHELYPETSVYSKKCTTYRLGTTIVLRSGNKYVANMFVDENNTTELFAKALRSLISKKNVKTIAFIDTRDDDLYVNEIMNVMITRKDIEFKVYKQSSTEEVTYENTTIVEFTNEFAPKGWTKFFEIAVDEIKRVSTAISKSINDGCTVYPPIECLYRAFEEVPLSELKVVILGQDPYHGFGEAHGYAFSVPKGTKIPPSLRVIQRELVNEGYTATKGSLRKWATQGVLLLNTALTVVEGQANSHSNAWKPFTEALIRYIVKNTEHCVFILWGKHANEYSSYINSKHTIITGGHPSPLNKTVPFLGTKPFSKTNSALRNYGMKEIDWNL